MIKTRLKQSFVFILITAFLSLQWSSAHIHLAAQHEHDGGQHQHAATAHNHQLTNHRDVIDSASVTHVTELVSHESHTVVELDQLCTLFHGKHIDQSPVIFSTIGALFYQTYGNEYDFKSVTYFSFNSYLETTSIRLRAPPSYS
jgi:hypothetical protein